MGKKQSWKNYKGKAKHKDGDAEDNAHPSRRRSKRVGNTVPDADDYKLRESIEADDNRTIMDMDADGNCLFRALSDQLYWDFGNMHVDIRSNIADYLEAFEEDFSSFLVLEDEDEDAADFESYVRNMRQDGEWGGNLELVAAARLYCREIIVFASGMSAFHVGPGDDKKPSQPPVLLSFHENQHYNSVRDIKVGKPPPPIKTFEKSDKSVDEIEMEQVSIDAESTDTDDDFEEEGVEVAEAPQLENGDTESESHESTGSKKEVKKSAPCPCGSGLRYKKCCWAKEKHADRLRKLPIYKNSRKHLPSRSSDEEEEPAGCFRVMKI